MIDDSTFSLLVKKIENLRPEMIEFQKTITNIKAISPSSGGDGEWDKTMYIKEYLLKRGLQDIKQIDVQDPNAKFAKRPNLIINIPG